jgi:hypothetical protein
VVDAVQRASSTMGGAVEWAARRGQLARIELAAALQAPDDDKVSMALPDVLSRLSAAQHKLQADFEGQLVPGAIPAELQAAKGWAAEVAASVQQLSADPKALRQLALDSTAGLPTEELEAAAAFMESHAAAAAGGSVGLLLMLLWWSKAQSERYVRPRMQRSSAPCVEVAGCYTGQGVLEAKATRRIHSNASFRTNNRPTPGPQHPLRCGACYGSGREKEDRAMEAKRAVLDDAAKKQNRDRRALEVRARERARLKAALSAQVRRKRRWNPLPLLSAHPSL